MPPVPDMPEERDIWSELVTQDTTTIFPTVLHGSMIAGVCVDCSVARNSTSR